MGKLRWSPDQFLNADLNAVLLAWEGYDDERDDLYRAMYRSHGGKYPDKKKRGSEDRPVEGWSSAELGAWLKTHARHQVEVDLSTLQ